MKTKILGTLLLVATILSACSDQKAEEKKLMDKVIAVHDSVMGKSEMAMKYKANLDSTAKTLTDTSKIHTVFILKSQLNMSEEAMETWMHKFNPDFAGKSHTDIMTYLQTQEKQIHRVDSLLSLAIDKSDKFLKSK